MTKSFAYHKIFWTAVWIR